MIVTRPNDHEKAAREAKAARLAAIVFERARDACFDYDNKQGVKPRSSDQCADDIIMLVTKMEPKHWIEVANAYGINTPSKQTMALAQFKVVERAQSAKAREEART